jgi:hypothetical protein
MPAARGTRRPAHRSLILNFLNGTRDTATKALADLQALGKGKK